MRILRFREVKGEVQDHIASNRVEFEPNLAGTRAQICDLYSTLPLRDPKHVGCFKAEPRLALRRTVSPNKLADLSYMVILGTQLPLEAHDQPGSHVQGPRKKEGWNVTVKSKKNGALGKYIASTVINT